MRDARSDILAFASADAPGGGGFLTHSKSFRDPLVEAEQSNSAER
jgi:hypothetical protein